MKKALALAVVLVFCAASGFAAGADKAVKPIEATISKLDMAGKSMVVKKADGKEMTIYWNDDTKIEGVLKEGMTIHFKTSEKDGKTWATKVHIAIKTKKAA